MAVEEIEEASEEVVEATEEEAEEDLEVVEVELEEEWEEELKFSSNLIDFQEYLLQEELKMLWLLKISHQVKACTIKRE